MLTAADGRTISYEVSGVGEPLVLVHGSFSDHISKRFAVFAMASRAALLHACIGTFAARHTRG